MCHIFRRFNVSAITLPSLSQSDLFFTWSLSELNRRLDEGDAVRAAVTADSWDTERAERRRRIAEVLVPDWPRVDPKVTVEGVIERSAWTISRIRFESLPDYWVTALLYVPNEVSGPMPGIVFPCGHSLEAKAYPQYHSMCEELTRQGMTVIAFDPVSQGERLQSWDYLNNNAPMWGTTEHDYMGHKSALCGWPLSQAFVWDGQRALDVLLAQENVDPERIGVCGQSGGGTQTTWLLAADDRFTAAAPSCYVTSWRNQFEKILGADPEQWPYPLMSWGWDQVDIVASFAPKPVRLVSAIQDFFPIEGTRETFGKLQDLYGKLGVPQNISMSEDDFEHGYYPPMRESTARFFCEQFGIEYDEQGEAKDICTPEELQVTQTGQLLTDGLGRTLHDWILERRPEPTGRRVTGDVSEWQKERRDGLAKVLAIPENAPEPKVVMLDENTVSGHRVESLRLVPEDGVELPAVLVHAEGDAQGVVIYAHELGADTGWRLLNGPLYKLVSEGWTVVAVDPRGIGAGRGEGDENQYFGRFGVEDTLAANWYMMGRSLVGQRVFDLLQTVRWVKGSSDYASLPLSMIGCGIGSTWVLFASALSGEIEHTVLHGPLCSYFDLLKGVNHGYSISIVVPDILTWGDMPDAAALIAPHKLTVVSPLDRDRRPLTQEAVRPVHSYARDAYAAFSAEGNLRVIGGSTRPSAAVVNYGELLGH